MNLARLLFSGYAGGAALVGESPDAVIRALTKRFDVVSAHVAGVYDRELRCYDPATGLRLRVQYRWDPWSGWHYQPVAVRRRNH